MSDVNIVVISGRLCADPELRRTPKGTAVSNFRLASNRFYADRESTVFIEVNLFGKPAETVSEYKKKGDPIIVKGRLELDIWKGRDGKTRQTYRITAQEVTFLPRGGESKAENTIDPGALYSEARNELIGEGTEIPF